MLLTQQEKSDIINMAILNKEEAQALLKKVLLSPKQMSARLCFTGSEGGNIRYAVTQFPLPAI